ncbi:MAG: hypothetical protein MH204_04155 [Fimbriimonadaceae bacterium]|nr:hypothetical protein [Fimbriimonadaceae bacterium]
MLDSDYRARLAAEFPSEPLPGEIVGEAARSIKPDGAAEIEAEFAGKSWLQITPALADRQAGNIICLTLEALAHHLPAFLAAAHADPDGDSATYLVYALIPLGGLDRFEAETVALFSPAQAALIHELLEGLAASPSFQYFRDEFPVGLALWRRRAAASPS